MSKIPKPLKKGDTIGLVCPSGFMPFEKVENCIQTLKLWGYKVELGNTVGSRDNYFSGSDETRLHDIQQMMDNKNIHAILCARGGYGLGRIIDRINFKTFIKNPKWIIGFSDITVLHSHLYSNYKIASLHAPMAGAFNENELDNEYINSLKLALEGKKANYTCASHPFNQNGKAKGKLIGGNLSLITHLIGTSSDVDTKGKVLFLEDVGEYIYNIDRMMYQLKRSGKLNKLEGLIIGGFTEIKDTANPFGQTAEEVIREVIKEFEFPYCFNFPVSHSIKNYALKIGVEYDLKINDKITSLIELK